MMDIQESKEEILKELEEMVSHLELARDKIKNNPGNDLNELTGCLNKMSAMAICLCDLIQFEEVGIY